MSMGGFSSVLSMFNMLPQIEKTLKVLPDEMVEQAAQEIVDLAAVNAPELTGFLASSIYWVSSRKSTYMQGIGTPPGDSFILESHPTPPRGQAYVGVAANYGIYVEMGTRNMSAQPYLTPAAEQVKTDFEGGALLTRILSGSVGVKL